MVPRYVIILILNTDQIPQPYIIAYLYHLLSTLDFPKVRALGFYNHDAAAADIDPHIAGITISAFRMTGDC